MRFSGAESVTASSDQRPVRICLDSIHKSEFPLRDTKLQGIQGAKYPSNNPSGQEWLLINASETPHADLPAPVTCQQLLAIGTEQQAFDG